MIFFIPKYLIDEFDSSEALSKDVFIYDDSIIVPYINLEVVSSIEFLTLNEKDVVKLSYLIFTGLSSIASTVNDFELSFSNKKSSNVNYIVCNNLSENRADELKIEFSNMYIYFPNNFKSEINKSDKKLPLDFFTKEKIPKEILELINLSDASELKLLNDNSYCKR